MRVVSITVQWLINYSICFQPFVLGIVQNVINQDGSGHQMAKVSFMSRKGQAFKWPDGSDVQIVASEFVLTTDLDPYPTNKSKRFWQFRNKEELDKLYYSFGSEQKSYLV